MKIRILATGFFLLWFLISQASTLTTNKSSYVPGEAISVTFDSSASKTDWIGMYNLSTIPGPQNSLAWLYLNGKQTAPSGIISGGTLVFTAPTTAGSYKMCFHPNDGYTTKQKTDH
jgi:hypothetical protein